MSSSAELIGSIGDLPRHEVERLMMTVTGRSRTEVIVGVDLDDEQRARFDVAVRRRRAGEPLQYIEGSVPFGPVLLSVDPRVLVPRPETEQLFELAVELVQDRPPELIVDLCTGSGALAVALARTFPQATVHATDLSADAAEVAAMNAAANDVAVAVHVGDLFAPLPPAIIGAVDLLVANPPYVARSEFAELPAEVRDHEPAMALIGGDDGTEIVRRIAAEAPRWMRPGGLVVCEIGETQAAAAVGAVGDGEASVIDDLAGRPRFVVWRHTAAGRVDSGS